MISLAEKEFNNQTEILKKKKRKKDLRKLW